MWTTRVCALLKTFRHILIYAIIYGILWCLIPEMEREVLSSMPLLFDVVSKAQSMDKIRDNILRAAFLATAWPFLACAGPTIFVELGCFSMTCFSIAAQCNPQGVLNARHKTYWRSILREASLRVPPLMAWRDENGRLHRSRTRGRKDSIVGVHKPNDGMYARHVFLETLGDFCRCSMPSALLEEEIVDIDGVRCRSFRVCTLRTRRNVRVISIFVVTRKDPSIPVKRWNQLVDIGDRLATIHANRVPWAPLIGWDVMIDKTGPVILEGNLGGSVTMQLMNPRNPMVSRDLARQWLDDLREAHRANVFDRPDAHPSVTPGRHL